jgi:hypothetical protein
VEWDDEKKQFRKHAKLDLQTPFYPRGNPFDRTEAGVRYIYFGDPFPLVRVRADADHLLDPSRYEAFTPLREGSRLEQHDIDRVAGHVRYAWKANTPPVGQQEQDKLIRAGKLKPEEALLHLCDVETGKPISVSAGSVYWNAYRCRWVMIGVQLFGTSMLGEVWYAEADTPLGPWVYARKIVTHDKYSFYNPKQHPMFDTDNGRVIYFEGTYSNSFSGNTDSTPRYDYNQLMYKLNLADPRLALPVAIYQRSKDEPRRFAVNDTAKPVAFFAPDRPAHATVPIMEASDGSLVIGDPRGESKQGALFYALPGSAEKPPPTVTGLYEFVHEDGKRRAYSTDEAWSAPGYRRRDKPLCFVWRSPFGEGRILSLNSPQRHKDHKEDPK